jgi:hypothetical protein
MVKMTRSLVDAVQAQAGETMSNEDVKGLTPRIQAAIEELRGEILKHYPSASFEVARGEDPDGIYLIAEADVDDTIDVFDVVVHRLVGLQVDEGLSLYVVPVQTPERVAALMRKEFKDRPTVVQRATLRS